LRVVEDNPAQSRFELATGEELAIAVYRREPGRVVFVHTEVPLALRGKGIGSELARGALELVRQRGDKVVPRCSFIAAFLDANPEFDELRVAPAEKHA
jgi:predicted GNAT family acetyltransferase